MQINVNTKRIIGKFFPKSVRYAYRNYEINKACKKHEGNNVLCPICNSSFDIFGDFGLQNRKNAKCYKCSSLERHRLLYLYLRDTLSLFDLTGNIKLLHFAPEKAFYDMFSNIENIDYYPCDLLPQRYDHGGKIKVHKVDITNIPFDSNTFDLIICNHVLEHIPNDSLAMNELFRVLKTEGKGYFQVPIDYSREVTYEDFTINTPKGREKAFGQHDHVRYYGQDYKDRLTKVGFTVNVDDFVNKMSDEEIFKYGLDRKELIYLCEK